MADALLQAAGLGLSDLGASLEVDGAKVADALCHNQIDAAVVTGLHPLPEVQEAIDDCGATLVPLKDPGIERFLKSNPAFSRQTLGEDTYQGVHERTATFGVNAVLVTTAALSVDDGYWVVKAVFDSLPAFKGMHPLLDGLDRKGMARDALVVPLHDGARRYFAENGLP